MSDISKKEVEEMAALARIELREGEAEHLTEDIGSILAYVSEINEITAQQSVEKHVGPLHNVMRDDGEPHQPGIYTEDLLDAAPDRSGRYIRVKKIHGED